MQTRQSDNPITKDKDLFSKNEFSSTNKKNKGENVHIILKNSWFLEAKQKSLGTRDMRVDLDQQNTTYYTSLRSWSSQGEAELFVLEHQTDHCHQWYKEYFYWELRNLFDLARKFSPFDLKHFLRILGKLP